jgi:hypothetical protein
LGEQNLAGFSEGKMRFEEVRLGIMDFFSAFSLLLIGAFLVSAFLSQRIIDPLAYRKALTQLLAALILYYPVSAIFWVGVYLSFVARPLGFVLAVVSFRFLCLAFIAPQGSGKKGGTDEAHE